MNVSFAKDFKVGFKDVLSSSVFLWKMNHIAYLGSFFTLFLGVDGGKNPRKDPESCSAIRFQLFYPVGAAFARPHHLERET